MPYSAAHKAQTRTRIIESARSLFNRRGFDQVSIDDVMTHAGLTRGGFYKHFGSKDALYAEAVASFVHCNPLAYRLEQAKSPRALAKLIVALYLSDEVLADSDLQCPLYALPSDVARAGLEPRAAYTQLIRNMTAVFRAAFSKSDRNAARKAQLMVSLCVGGMVLARTTDDPTLRRTLRASAREEALALLGSR